jgi:peroxiredoxin family protein
MTVRTDESLDRLVRAHVEREVAALKEAQAENRVTLVVFSGDLDRNLAALVIATGAAAMGMSVSIFYTFWGLSALKKKRVFKGKSLKERMFALMTPRGLSRMPVSKMNFGGAGRAMLKKMMSEKQVSSIEDLFALSREMGVKLIACTMSMDVMGITADELVDGVALGGVATFLGDAARSKVSLFI